MEVKIIKLPIERWEEYKQLRLESLENEPTAFAASFKESSKYSDDKWKEIVAQYQSGGEKIKLFAEVEGQLVGMVGVNKNDQQKRRHAISIVSVYVKPKYRGKGFATKLMQAILGEATSDPQIIKFDLDVNVDQKAAQALYQKFGFKIVGTWEKELKVDGKYYDLYEMEKILTERL